jgi:hypothetical protein
VPLGPQAEALATVVKVRHGHEPVHTRRYSGVPDGPHADLSENQPLFNASHHQADLPCLLDSVRDR